MRYKNLWAAASIFLSVTAQAQTARIETSMGDFSVELNAKAAPKTVANFIHYAQNGHYEGTIFHRVIRNFMIQGGGFNAQMQERNTDAPIVNEAFNGLKNDKYTIAMARTSALHSATAQFFINVKTNDFLNHTAKTNDGYGYAVFGRVTSGFEVVDKIKGAYTKTVMGFDDVPMQPIVIKAVTITP